MKRFSLRLPDSLHDCLAAQARRNRRSLNDEILHLVAKGIERNRTYRVTRKADADLYIPSWFNAPDGVILDTWLDVDASTEEQAVGEYLVSASVAESFERLLDASPAVVRWEEVPTDSRWQGRRR
jgi:hypothetical protein